MAEQTEVETACAKIMQILEATDIGTAMAILALAVATKIQLGFPAHNRENAVKIFMPSVAKCVQLFND